MLFAAFGVFLAFGGADAAPGVALSLLTAVLIWGTPRIQANHVFRTVSWQGEYRATVSDAGITVETEHTTLTQRWSLFRGHRETRDHLVLLGRDPNILILDVVPKRGLRTEEDMQRLRTLLAGHLPRV
ncbi:YcxB family protein [Streptomyces sp. TRM70350]|uniref:YcxB family protein n=1 Tax=Streptomyces sp. TRM70350 TaxID=2856165 RepID=UPI0027E079DD|nr:YcxB family protein [Streptomyces sp. TRM70350]